MFLAVFRNAGTRHRSENLKPEMIRVALVHPGEFVLPELGEELGRYTSRKLAERGVEIYPNTKVKGVTSTEVELTDGTWISSYTLVWTAGTSPHPLLNQLKSAQGAQPPEGECRHGS